MLTIPKMGRKNCEHIFFSINFEKHLGRKSVHIYMNIFEQKTTKTTENYCCELCDYICSDKSNYLKHINTKKHKNKNFEPKTTETTSPTYTCSHCHKQYKNRNGLWYHNKKCGPTNIVEILIKENSDFKNLMLEMMNSNKDLQKQMLDVCKNSNHTTHNNNSHNKTFNMQFFLNEQCKDAMNIKDFIDSFQLQFADLERVGELGYVDGISDIIIKKLNEMDVYKRPIHCSDTKRDIMYVRAENVWEKETNSYDRLRFLIRQITHQNIKLIPLWAATHPQARDNQHPLNDTYLGMVGQAMGGRGDLEESENKIIKKIAKTVYIDKYE